jgi:hypothetical protein
MLLGYDTIDNQPPHLDGVTFDSTLGLRRVIVSYRDFLRIRFTLIRFFVPPPLPGSAAFRCLRVPSHHGTLKRLLCRLHPCNASTVGLVSFDVPEEFALLIDGVRVASADQRRGVFDTERIGQTPQWIDFFGMRTDRSRCLAKIAGAPTICSGR